MIVINTSTRQFNIPGADMTFGVEADAGSERKHFQCPRYVGNNLDLMGSFVRLNYRNANGEVDSYLVEDMTVDGDNVLFSWELSPKVTAYKGQIRFVLCVVGPDTKVAWHTTLGTGVVLEGLEPDAAVIQNGTVDVVAALITMVGQQTGAVEAEGANQIKAMQTAAQTAQSDAVAQIEAKGASTLATIPEDYTTVQNAVRGAANAIRKKVSGEVIRVDDVSPMEHYPTVKVSGKNLIPYPYWNGTKTVGGVSFTDNGDGGVTMSGTSTGGCNFYFTDYNFKLEKGKTYTFSVSGDFTGSGDINFWIYSNAQQKGVWLGAASAESYTFTTEHEYTEAAIYILVNKGTSVSGVVYPMLEYGETATDYTPYIDPTTVTVRRCGKNLLSLPYYEGQKVERDGITATVNADGGVHLVGTATANYFYRFGSINLGSTPIMAGNNNGRYSLQNCTYDSANKFVYHQVSKGQTVDKVVYAMVEAGTVKTAYETPSTTVTQIPSSDGTVSGLSAVPPTMTLMTDTPGVSIECEYSRDTNKVIAEILEKITALGG